jgi:hypothetical protein
VRRVLAALAGLLASVALPASASAFTPPELYVRLQTWDTHEAASGWMPLASAARLNYLAGYQIGYKLQSSSEANNFQRVALTVTGVPDGDPSQPYNAQPFCVGRAGAVGTIVEAGPELQFEGDGRYSVKVSVGDDLDCVTAGQSSTGSFSVDVHTAPAVVGEPLSFRADPLPGDPFVGVRAPVPPGGEADVRCALNGIVKPDGSVTGSLVVPDTDFSHATLIEDVFPRPGTYKCVARGTAEGVDDSFDTVTFGTPWSVPRAVVVRTDFRRKLGKVAKRGAKRPRFRFIAEWPAAAKGGRATIRVFRVRGCKGSRYKLRKVSTVRGRFGAKRLELRIRRPRAGGFYIATVAFAGTQLVRAGVDPNPVLLLVANKRFGFADPHNFPHCP